MTINVKKLQEIATLDAQLATAKKLLTPAERRVIEKSTVLRNGMEWDPVRDHHWNLSLAHKAIARGHEMAARHHAGLGEHHDDAGDKDSAAAHGRRATMHEREALRHRGMAAIHKKKAGY